MFEFGIVPSIFMFAAVSTVVWLLLTKFVQEEGDEWKERLDVLVPQLSQKGVEISLVDDDKGDPDSVVSMVVPKLSYMLQPKDMIENQAIKHMLTQAGFSGNNALPSYLALKFLSMVAFTIIGTSLGLGAFEEIRLIALLGVGGAAFGLIFPVMVLKRLALARQDRIFLALPGAIDLLIIALEAGTAIDQAMAEVANEMKDMAPDLSEEFQLYGSEMRLGGNRHKALHNLAKRAGVDDLNALANVLLQADRFGTSIAMALRDMSRQSRSKRRQRAEERASKTAVTLLIPLILFIFPGIFVILVAPAAISIYRDMMSM